MNTTAKTISAIAAAVAAAVAIAAGASTIAAADTLDTNGDGVYSLAELQSAYPDLTAETFAKIDLNADGVVDDAELQAAQDAKMLPANG